MGGIGSFFQMFFNAAAGLGHFGEPQGDDIFGGVHPMARGRPDRAHLHSRMYIKDKLGQL